MEDIAFSVSLKCLVASNFSRGEEDSTEGLKSGSPTPNVTVLAILRQGDGWLSIISAINSMLDLRKFLYGVLSKFMYYSKKFWF